MKQRERREENDAWMLAQSCCAGVASGDGRHLHTNPNPELVLDDGSAIRFATVLRTASAPLREGRCATTGQSYCPNSVGPQSTVVLCVRSELLPTSPRAMPLDPSEGTSSSRGPRLRRPTITLFPPTMDSVPGPFSGSRTKMGPRFYRPTLSFPSDQELRFWTSREKRVSVRGPCFAPYHYSFLLLKVTNLLETQWENQQINNSIIQ